MSKEKSPEVNYEALWRSFDKWQQEDKLWYDTRKAEQDKGADLAGEKALMASRGLQAGSDAWERQLETVKAKRPDIDAQYAAKQADLKDSIVYQDLQAKYNYDEGRRKKTELRKFGLEQQRFYESYRDANQYAADGLFGQGTGDKARFGAMQDVMRVENPDEFQFDSSKLWTNEVDADVEYNEEGMRQLGFDYTPRTLEEWGAATYGSETVDPALFKDPEATAAEKAEARVKIHGQGRGRGGSGTAFALTAFEEDPWML